MRFVIAIMVITVLKVSSSEPVRYDNFAVYKVHINNPEQRRIIDDLLNHPNRYNLWHNGRTEIHIAINPEELPTFKRIVKREGLQTELLIPNIQALIDAERNTRR